MEGLEFSELTQDKGFMVVKTQAADGYKKIIDYGNTEEFEYEGERWVVVKKYNGRGNIRVKRLSDGKEFRMTPFTIVKIV